MRKIAYTILLAALTTVNITAQKNRIYENEKSDFAKGRELFDQRHFAISTKYFEKFLAAQRAAENMSMQQEAEYYIACNAYELKQKSAAKLLEKYVEKHPNSAMNSRVYYMLGRIYYEKKAYAEAIKYYDKIKNAPLSEKETEEYLFTKAHSHLILKEYKKASAIFSSLTGNKNYGAESAYYHAYSEFCQKNYKIAGEAFEAITEESKFYESSQFFLLQICDQLKLHNTAVEFGKKLITKFPSSHYISEAYRILGENCYYKSEWADAATYLQNYASREKKVQRSAMYMLGIAYYQTGEYNKSITSLGKVTTETDTLAQNAYLFIGHAHLKLNKADKSRMSFQSASLLEADKKLQEESLYNYALATYESKAPFGEMLKAFERFVNEYPNSEHLDAIYEHMSDVYLTEKNYTAALLSIQNIKKQTPKLRQAKEQALFQLGVEAFNLENYTNAIELFSKSLKENNKNSFSAQAYLWRGEAYYQQGNLSAARDNINAFLSKSQGKTSDQLQKAYYTLGYTYFETNSYNLAKPYFLRFMDIKGSEKTRLYSDVLNRLADCYFYNRDFEGARKMYDKVPSSSIVADYAIFQNAFILGLQKQYDAKISSLNKLINKYPHSDYNDDAMYEIGRTYVLQEKYSEAISAYQKLQTAHPQSQLTRKSTLEIGMMYANMGDITNAIAAYKYVIERYPTSEETRVALEGLQTLYIDENKVDEYIAYRESISGTTISTVAKSQEDSLSFIAAENVFAKGKYAEAITTLNKYLVKYCETPTLNCITAQYYLAESYYNTGDKQKALNYYDKLALLDGNTYMENSLLRASEISYDMKNYTSAGEYFAQLHVAASNKENRNAARIGVLRCSYYTTQYQTTINISNEIISDASSDEEIIAEARYCRAKSYLATGDSIKANDDLRIIGVDISTANGAEAKYLYAQNLYETNKIAEAEAEIISFIDQGTTHQYWLARCFVLLSDIYKSKGDNFMAKQYLLSLKENYTETNDIQQMIEERLGLLQELESEDVLQ